MQPIQTGKIDIPAIHNVDGPSFRHEHVECMHIVQLSVGNIDEARDIAAQVQQRVYFYRRFGGSEMRPWEQRQTQVNGGRVQRVNVVQVPNQALAYIKPSGLRDQPLGERRVNAPVTDLVGIRQRRSPDRSPKAQVPEFCGLSRQAHLDIAQAFAVCQLRKCHGPVLLGARKCLHRVVAVITCDESCECAPRQAIHQLREKRLSSVHGRVLPGKGSGRPPPTSSRHHAKSAKSRYRSDTSV